MATPQIDFNLDEYIPAKLTLIGRKLNYSVSADLKRFLGVDAIDLRVVDVLKKQPGTSAIQISRKTSCDKALISRHLKQLNHQGYAATRPDQQKRNQTKNFITKKGEQLHAKMVLIIKAREKILLSGLTQKEKDTFLKTLSKIDKNAQILIESEGISDPLTSQSLKSKLPAWVLNGSITAQCKKDLHLVVPMQIINYFT